MNGEPTKVRDVLRGRHALVTGSSSGLGAEFARELARHGCDLTLVARREDRLQALRQELCARYGVKVFVVPADLTMSGATQRLYEAAKESGKPVDVLQQGA